MLSGETVRSNIEDWLEAMDWSKLHTLHLTKASSTFLQSLKGTILHKLKRLSPTGGNSKDASAYEDFVAETVLPLESLSLKSMSLEDFDSLLDIISQRHSELIKHLNLTGYEKPGNPHLFLNSTSLSRLRLSCPNLVTLEIDIPIILEWDYPLLIELAQYPNLRHLTLRLEFQYPKDASSNSLGAQTVLVDASYYRNSPRGEVLLIDRISVHGLFRYLRKRKIGLELKSLDLSFDVWPEMNGPYYMPEWEYSVVSYRYTVDGFGVEGCRERRFGIYSDEACSS